MNTHNAVFHFIKALAPLDALESEAISRGPNGAQRGCLFILHRGGSDFSYQWGDAEVSRNEAARRLQSI